ncbi:holo-ACP synthase [Indioceanicola profundi]|uniref:holo-ACP synthase n=1 Tax=Indioceanicola profundi TaxID=2220096 RepID=UPI000E6ACBBA|nr:holo-ACP synthase [Indioceanicola profundi]
MIIGIGSDLCDVRRIQRSIERFGDRFLDRVYTETERRKADRRGDDGPHSPRTATYAKRFAAKEACAKALGTGFRDGVFFRDMGVVNLPSGQPTLHLTGGALERLRRITPPGMEARIHLSMTDELPLAMAYVIIDAVPSGTADPSTGGPHR